MHDKLLHVLTEHDRKQASKPSYNRYALAQYCEALAKLDKMIDAGDTPRQAILACFCGSLADKLLRSAKLPLRTRDELFN